MGDKIPVTAKVEEPLADRLDQWADEHGMTRSAAVRDIVKERIEGTEDETAKTSFPAVLSVYLAWLGSLMAAVTFLESTSVTFGYAGTVIFVTGLIYYTVHR